MNRHFRESLAVIEGLVTPHGLTCRVQTGRRHPAVMVEGAGGVRVKFMVSSSPRDSGCQLDHKRQQVAAWLRSKGFTS